MSVKQHEKGKIVRVKLCELLEYNLGQVVDHSHGVANRASVDRKTNPSVTQNKRGDVVLGLLGKLRILDMLQINMVQSQPIRR